MQTPLLSALALAACSVPALGTVEGFKLGTGAPPAEIAGRPMTAAPFDGRLFQDVLSCPDAFGGDIIFDHPVSCRRVGDMPGWATWSHGYSGNVYWSGDDISLVTVTFSPGTKAFYFYAEPDAFITFGFTVTGSDGTSSTTLTESIAGDHGAAGFAFYTTDGSDLAPIRIQSEDLPQVTDFAIGEFATSRAVPAPGAVAVPIGFAVATRRRRPRTNDEPLANR